jgi:hypothetical protein
MSSFLDAGFCIGTRNACGESARTSLIKRHIRKYAEGILGADNSFYFRGPYNALDLRAQLWSFFQIADGVDDRTWTHHLRQGDYSAWFLM